MLTAQITLSKRLFVYVLRRVLLVTFLGFNGLLLLAQTQITPSPSYSYNTSPSGSYPDNSPVSKLTDGIKSVNVWPNTAATASLVGWNLANPSIRFIFSGGPVSINQISVWAADSEDAAGVGLPVSITISAGGTSKTISVTNPSGSGTTVSLNLTGLYLYDDTVTLVMNRNHSWTMLSEIEFYGPGGSPLSISSATEVFSDYNGNLISQEITGTGNISVLGNGVLNLGGNNSFSGGSTIPSQSYLRVSSNTALGTGSIAVNGTNSGNGSTLDLNGNTISNDISTQYLNSGQTVAGLGCIQNTNTTTTAVLNGKWTLGGNNYVGGDGNLTLNGLVTGGLNNSYSIYKQGSGIWKFTNNSNTFDGFYYHIGGTTEFTSIANINEASALGKPTTSTTNQVAFGFSSAGGGTLRFVGETSSTSSRAYTILGSTLTTNKIEASGTSSTATLTLTGNLSPGVSGSHSFAFGGTNTGINTFSGIIGNGSGTLSLTKEGVTTWTLSGANTYTGATTVSAGVLNLQNNTGVGTTAGGVSVTSGAALELQGSVTIGAEALTINSTGISSGGALRNISGNNTWGGTVTLGSSSRINCDAGTLTLSASTAITGTFPLTIGGDGNTTVSGAITTSTGSLTKDGNGTLTLTGSNTYTGGTNINGGIISLGSSNALGTTGTISFGGGTLQYSSSNTTDNSSRFSNAANQSYSIHTNGQNVTLASALTSTSGTMTKLGTGVLTLTGANTYSGTTTISAGTLQIGSGSTAGVVGSGNVTNDAALIINRSDNLTVSNIISGTGTFTKSGSGILTLSATNTYTGATTISAGELRVNGSIASSSGLTVSSGTTLSGTGTLPATTVSGTHAPGTSPGVQSVTGNLTYNAGSSINWELISNAIGTRGTNYDGIDVTGNLNFAGATNLNLIFNGAGSSVDWTNAFWSTAKTGINGWKLFEVTGTISNLNNITVNAASQWIDINSRVLRTQRVSNGTFALEQVGTAVYLTYTPLPVSAFTISGINSVVQVNTAITGIEIRAVDANGTTVSTFTSTATLSGTANFTGTTASFTAGVLTTSLTPSTTGSALTLIVTNNTYSITGTATFDVVSSLLTGSRVVDGTSGSATNTSYYSTTGGLTLSQGFFVDYLIVAGGGAGGTGKNQNPGGGGGGGAGGVSVGSTNVIASNYSVVIGAGGISYNISTGAGYNGGNSSAFGITAIGGGGGGSEYNAFPAANGGSGGGRGGNNSNANGFGTGTTGQGNNGGLSANQSAGGGGGGGAVGSNGSGTTGGAGGAGIASSITGSSVNYGGGGGGGTSGTGSGGAGGTGGGAAGGSSSGRNGGNGTPNTGGGGGGAGGGTTGSASAGSVGNGGSGVVILRYPGESVGSVGGTVTSFTGNGTIGESGVTYNVHTFTSSGNFNLSSLNLNDRLSSTLTQGISGSGAFTYSGPGRLVLSANSTYTGNTTISAGTLQIGNGSTTGSLGTGSITNDGTLSFQRSNDYTVPGAISGTGTVEQFGAGTLNLGGLTNHQAGTWTLRSGSISNGTITSGNFSMIDGTASAVLGGTGALTKTGGGTVTLSGNNTYSGTTTVSAGTLIVNGTNSGSGAVTVASGAVLKGTGTIAGATTIQSGATLEPGNRLGTLNLGGGLTLNGGGHLNFLIDDASGTAGTDWNNINVTGALTINATAGSKFNINVGSILANGSNGELANFSPTLNTYSWTILTATSINGFDAAAFQINLDASNGMGGLISKYKVNGFSIVQDGNTLKLTYTPPAIQAIDGTNNGTETTSYTTNTSANSLTLNQAFYVDYLIVGGGGAGGYGKNRNPGGGGGGGAGGVQTGSSTLNTINYTVTVGAGGISTAASGAGNNGGNSSALGINATGGGGGASEYYLSSAGSGGSGGGAGGNGGARGIGASSQGNDGGLAGGSSGGGGGGASAVGSNGSGTTGGAGGIGIASSITGTSVTYGGGGGGGTSGTGAGGAGGTGGGGAGGGSSARNGVNGTANTGGGGGGAGGGTTGSANSGSVGNGGSGVVIIRYEGASLGSVGGTVTSFTGNGTNGKNGVLYQVHTFNSSSSFNLSSVSLPSRLRATLTGNVVGTGNLIYAGPGVLSLTGTGHTYTGSTSITAGELRVNSSIATSSGVTVSSGATLSGTGTLPATTVSGTHAPGTSPGVQAVTGNLTYNAGSSINWELISNAIGTRGTDYDGIDVTGNLNFAGATTLNLIFNSTGSLVDWADNFWRNAKTGTNGWKLFDVTGSVTGLNNVTVTLSSAATDKDGDLLSAQRSGLTTSFSLVQSGTGIYINYTATPISTTWTGTTSTDWNTGSNWSSNSTPSADNQITIANTARSPSFTGTATYRSLTVNTGATFNITSGTMSIYEDVTNNGTIAGAGTLQLNGTSAQTISGTGTIGNITINNTSGGVSIASGSNKQYITGVFTPTSGVTTTNGNLVFRSTASAEGVVGTVGTCPTEPISGNVTVEKYIPAKRAFRFLTPGVTTTTTIKANWQEGGVVTTPGFPGTYPTDATANPNAGYGTHITGAGGAANGFDETVTNNPSLFTFNPNSNLWVAATSTNAPTAVLSQGEAYRILFRGSRAVNMNDNAAVADATTLRTTGTLKVCNTMSFTTSSTIPLNPSATGYSFIGNPYWSVVDWHTVTKSGVEDNLYYWDPTMNGTNGRGAYVTYNAATGVNNISPAGASQVSRYIQPGQAFFVRNTTATPTLTIAPTDIVGSSPSRTLIFSKNNVSAGAELVEEDRVRVRGNTSTSVEKIYVSLLLKNKLSSGPADGFVVAYANNFTDEYGREDAAKFGNLDENISAFYKGIRQSILGMQSVSATQLKSDTIPVSMSNLYDGEYVMRISVDKSVDPSREIYLLNRTTKQQTKIDNLNGLDHAFLISAGMKTKDDLALVVNSRRITTAPRSRSKQLVVYPNPLTIGLAEIVVPNTDGKMMLFNSMSRVEVVDNTGQTVISQTVMLDAMGRGSIDLNGIASGGYVVRVYVGNQVFTSKLLKQ